MASADWRKSTESAIPMAAQTPMTSQAVSTAFTMSSAPGQGDAAP